MLFLGPFLDAFDSNGKVLSIFFKKLGAFQEAFLGAIDKYVKILCYFWDLFQRFGSIQKLFGPFLTNFEISTEILGFFSMLFSENSQIQEIS